MNSIEFTKYYEESIEVKNARFALETARKNFYKNPRNKNRDFTLTLEDFLPKE